MANSSDDESNMKSETSIKFTSIEHLVVPLSIYPVSLIHGFTNKNPNIIFSVIDNIVPAVFSRKYIVNKGIAKFSYEDSEDEESSMKFTVMFNTHDDDTKKKYLLEIYRTSGDAFFFADISKQIKDALKQYMTFEKIPSFSSNPAPI